MGNSAKKPIKLYHYTDKQGKNAILQSRYIKMSDDRAGDAILGDGVYLTSMSPFDHSRESIVMNNWLDPSKTAKTEYVFEVKVSPSNLQKNEAGDRDIYVFPLENLILSLLPEWVLYEWKSDKPPVKITSGVFVDPRKNQTFLSVRAVAM